MGPRRRITAGSVGSVMPAREALANIRSKPEGTEHIVSKGGFTE